jgi:hypothetical protein
MLIFLMISIRESGLAGPSEGGGGVLAGLELSLAELLTLWQ